MSVTNQSGGFSVKAYQGDAKTLLAFNLTKTKTKNLAGFSIRITPGNNVPYYQQNDLRFKDPSQHAQDATQPANSSLNAPFHKFRWLHVPGSLHQGLEPFYGPYKYEVTPRYFDGHGSMLAIDPGLSVSVTIGVGPFTKGAVSAGFTRGFVQSQAFVHHFGPKAVFRPAGKDLQFDTSTVAGKNSAGQNYTFLDEYKWLGFTARTQIFAIANEVLNDSSLRMDVFAYDLNEPDLTAIFLQLAKQGRIRMILDNAALHHDSAGTHAEDQFETLFRKADKTKASIKRGRFGRYAHDKVFIVYDAAGAKKVLTGSTNFSITGLYVNSNHVLVFNDQIVAGTYGDIFQTAWDGDASESFNKSPEAAKVFNFASTTLPSTDITFSPHPAAEAKQNLDNMVTRINQEKKAAGGSVLFAVMAMNTGGGPVLPALISLHASEDIFTYGISDSPGGIYLYTPRSKRGVLVTGKPAKTKLPPPFDQVPGIGIGHQIHHKFVVCGFNGKDPVVYCGSSNLALGGEESNGDNLIAIHDADLACVFAIEALALVDHFDFLDRSASTAGKPAAKIKSASKQQQAADAGWFLSTTDTWVRPYFDPNDLHCADRELFA